MELLEKSFWRREKEGKRVWEKCFGDPSKEEKKNRKEHGWSGFENLFNEEKELKREHWQNLYKNLFNDKR